MDLLVSVSKFRAVCKKPNRVAGRKVIQAEIISTEKQYEVNFLEV
jgi:hypothetical protein